MTKFKKISALCCAVILTASFFGINAFASQGTTYTYTVSNNGDYIRTQEAYVPSAFYLGDAGLSQPNDIFIKDDLIYVSDTGNRRVVVYNRTSGDTSVIENEGFVSPMGIFVNETNIYISDPDAAAVFITDLSGNLVKTITRPENSPIMTEDRIFKPTNAVVTKDNSIFIVGESSYDGLMQFNSDGEFEGYFAANKRSLTLLERIQELLFSREQKAQLLTRKPRAIQNIDISSRDLIYSVTQSAEISYTWSTGETKTSNALKLHNMAGTNILSTSKFMDDEWNFVDVAAGPYNNVYALTYTGLIYEYDSDGNLIFSFGGRAVSNDRYGLFTYAAAIDIDDDGFIYVLDKERALVQVFVPTDFAVATHKAIYDLENGNYEEAQKNWESVLQLNGMSRIAHVGYGKSLMRNQQYEEALKHFRIAEDKENYSNCFWEIRNQLLVDFMPYIVIALFLILVLTLLRQFVFKKRKKHAYSSYYLEDISAKGFSKFTKEFEYSFNIIKHPIDTCYYIKHSKRGTLLSAAVTMIIAFAVYMLDLLGRAFIFQRSINDVTPLMLSLIFFVSLLLFVVGNYMISTINDGEGSLKNIFIVTNNALIPYIIIAPITVALSYVLSANEGFILDLIYAIGIAWSAALVFLGIMQIHNYNFKQTVKNILLTLFFMILALVVVAIMYLVWDKAVMFANEVITEAIYRATE